MCSKKGQQKNVGLTERKSKENEQDLYVPSRFTFEAWQELVHDCLFGPSSRNFSWQETRCSCYWWKITSLHCFHFCQYIETINIYTTLLVGLVRTTCPASLLTFNPNLSVLCRECSKNVKPYNIGCRNAKFLAIRSVYWPGPAWFSACWDTAIVCERVQVFVLFFECSIICIIACRAYAGLCWSFLFVKRWMSSCKHL